MKTNHSTPIYGGIEAGGTKMLCAIGDNQGTILDKITIPTEFPDKTVPQMIDYFRHWDILSLGIACFGPIDLRVESTTYGYIKSTPKLAWRNYNILGAFQSALKLPIGFDTDVNGSLLGEVTWGAAAGLSDALYLTVGTGIGAGILSGGRLVHGIMHPEAGHIIINPHSTDSYTGCCPYHKNCLEGLASGTAVSRRWGKPAYQLSDRIDVWELEADYIAQALVNYIMILSPERIILGGGVMHENSLFPLIRSDVLEKLGAYIETPELKCIDSYIVPASLGDDQGLMGALSLAIAAHDKEKSDGSR